MRSRRSRLHELLETGRATLSALSELDGITAPSEARACLDELHYATTWFCEGLDTRLPRSLLWRPARGPVHSLAGRVMAAPAVVDRLRLVNHNERSVLRRIDELLTESLDSELRTFLTNSRAIVARGIHCCEEAIAVLDRNRELRGGRLDDAPPTAHARQRPSSERPSESAARGRPDAAQDPGARPARTS